MKIGEIVAASVIDGLVAKLQLNNPEELKIAYPVIVQGARYDFYCLVEDILNEPSDIADQLAGSSISDIIVPRPETHEGYGGPIFYSKAKLRMIQLVDKESKALSEPQTIPPYFSECRHATKADVERIYEPTEKSAPLGTITGVEPFYVHVDMEKLVEKPFAIFGRTGTGKSILNKLICTAILAKDAGSVLIFDMHGEYGIYSKTDGTEGLKYFFPHKVETFSLDPKNTEAKPFVLDPDQITPEDLIIAFQDLTPPMIDHIYAIYRTKPRDVDLVTAIREKQASEAEVEGGQLHLMVLQALQRRMGRFQRLPFIKKGARDAFGQMIALIKEGKSVVLDFGDFGTDQMVYLFVANVLARRLFELYTEQTEKFPRLVLFLEEAHKFLDPRIAEYSIFSRLARETRKFNLILALIDQRPSRIDDEVRSQLANRLVMSLKEPSDVESALAGVPDKGMWVNIVAKLPLRTVAVLGDAIRIPTVIDVLEYEDLKVRKYLLPPEVVDEGTLSQISDRADDVLGRG
jgi:DNA helicase HerA-like ATPase